VIVSYSYEKLKKETRNVQAVSSFSVDALARRVSHNSTDSLALMFEAIIMASSR
jgi:hypothetical protein